jgi:hypothetical protein
LLVQKFWSTMEICELRGLDCYLVKWLLGGRHKHALTALLTQNKLLLLSFTSFLKYGRVVTHICLLNYHSFTFTTRLIIFLYYVYALVLFIQYCITVLVSF